MNKNKLSFGIALQGQPDVDGLALPINPAQQLGMMGFVVITTSGEPALKWRLKQVSILGSVSESHYCGWSKQRCCLFAAFQVRIAKQLTLDRTTKPAEIAILTPYNAQVVEIKKLLLQAGLRDVTVCTIMKSQGKSRPCDTGHCVLASTACRALMAFTQCRVNCGTLCHREQQWPLAQVAFKED